MGRARLLLWCVYYYHAIPEVFRAPAAHYTGRPALRQTARGPSRRPAAPAGPPYAPELNPVERFFRELRRAEGKVYPTLQAKQAALEPVLNAWQADPEWVRRLCGWTWIRKALKNLPDDTPAAPAGPLA